MTSLPVLSLKTRRAVRMRSPNLTVVAGALESGAASLVEDNGEADRSAPAAFDWEPVFDDVELVVLLELVDVCDGPPCLLHKVCVEQVVPHDGEGLLELALAKAAGVLCLKFQFRFSERVGDGVTRPRRPP